MKEEITKHLKRTEELLIVAKELIQNEHYSDSISRSYYAIFHAATAILKEIGIERKSHHALWAAFGEFITSKGLMDVKYHRYALDAFSERSLSDYLSQPEDTREDAQNNLEKASEFVNACRIYLNRSQ